MAVITEVRREKAEKRMPLNTQIMKLTVYVGDAETAAMIREGEGDIAGACKVAHLEVLAEKGNGREVALHGDVHFVTEY